MEFLHRKILQFLSENLMDIARPSYGNAVFAVLRSHPAAKLERRMNGDSASRSNSRQGSERRDWLRGKPAK